MLSSGIVIALISAMRMLIIILFLFFLIPSKAYSGVPELPALKAAMELVKSKKPSEALKILSTYKSSPKELYSYHYAFAKAYELLGKQQDSLAHYRLAYIYSPDGEVKEIILLERAEAYFMMKYYPESAVNFRSFLKRYPDSRYSERVHLGLADSLYHQGIFGEALLHYEKSGNSSRALFGRANAYQAMGRTKDATTLYMSTIKQDREFLRSSQETLYNIAENFRLIGQSNDAKIFFSSIEDPFFKRRADIGLGLIAMEEGNYDSASRHFKSALDIPHRQLQREARILLANAYAKAGKKESVKALLLEIRNKYPYGKEYDAALLMLSRLYRDEGKVNEALSLMKELASGRSPTKDAVDEFETLILDAKNKDGDELLKRWRFFGRFLKEPSRSKSLVEIAEGLRSSEKPFIDLCKWILTNGSIDTKAECSLSLAQFYAETGDAATASTYLRGIKGNTDDVLRIRARIYKEKKENQKAVNEILSIKDMKPEDVAFFADLLKYAKDINKAVAFCDKSLMNVGAPLKVYIKLADTLYGMGRESDALKFYGIVASSKAENRRDLTQDDIGWTYYMAQKLSQGQNPAMLPAGAEAGNNLFSRSAESAVKEANILERMRKIF